MVEKLKAMVKSRRFWTAVGSVVVICLNETLGIPEETANERNAHFERQTENQMRAVDNDLMREENPAMPMTRERKTQVSFGKGRA